MYNNSNMGSFINIKEFFSTKRNKTIHKTYYYIAYQSYLKVIEYRKLEFNEYIKEILGVTNATPSDYLNFMNEKFIGIKINSIITIIFCALTLESFINYYGTSNLGKKYYKYFIERIGTVTKWEILPKLIIGKEFSLDSEIIKKINDLFNLRNELVHYKPKIITEFEYSKKIYKLEIKAGEYIELVEKSLKLLKEIDSSINIEWLEKVKTEVINKKLKI